MLGHASHILAFIRRCINASSGARTQIGERNGEHLKQDKARRRRHNRAEPFGAEIERKGRVTTRATKTRKAMIVLLHHDELWRENGLTHRENETKSDRKTTKKSRSTSLLRNGL